MANSLNRAAGPAIGGQAVRSILGFEGVEQLCPVFKREDLAFREWRPER